MVDHAAFVHRLKVTLKGSRPPIWRRIEVRSDSTLLGLAGNLEAAMGWWGDHLHGFELRGVRYQPRSPAEPDFGGLFESPRDESDAVLGDVLAGPKARMTWTYDFGDNWEHDVVVEAVEAAAPDVDYPRCLTGKTSGSLPASTCCGRSNGSSIKTRRRDGFCSPGVWNPQPTVRRTP